MTPDQIQLIKNTWLKVFPISEQAAAMFYNRLFEIEPSVKSLFKGDMQAQGVKLMTTISLVVGSLDALENILPAVQQLGRDHVAYGVVDAHYQPVGEALLWTLEQGIGDDFTPAVKEAWATAYTTLATVMMDAAREVPAA
ncbi:MAG: globin domain-containing protein [Nitrospirota bacterium]|nr:globin domain-containing protein [Nitrospirota bacterium]